MTKTEVIKSETQKSYSIKVITSKTVFQIPVVDCRDGQIQKEAIQAQLKENRRNAGSKFMRPSYSQTGHSYQVSRKRA